MLRKSLLISSIIFTMLIGCAPENRSPTGESTSPQRGNEQQKASQISYPNQTDMKQNKQTSRDVANRLVRLALSDPHVQDATAVVVGKIAVVGIDLPGDLEAARVSTIKYSVAQSLKEDPLGANALVTSDPDLVERIRQMARRIREGHPAAGVMDELADIVARIMPQVPRQVERREKPPTPDLQKRQNQRAH